MYSVSTIWRISHLLVTSCHVPDAGTSPAGHVASLGFGFGFGLAWLAPLRWLTGHGVCDLSQYARYAHLTCLRCHPVDLLPRFATENVHHFPFPTADATGALNFRPTGFALIWNLNESNTRSAATFHGLGEEYVSTDSRGTTEASNLKQVPNAAGRSWPVLCWATDIHDTGSRLFAIPWISLVMGGWPACPGEWPIADGLR